MAKHMIVGDPLDPNNVFSPYKLLAFPGVLKSARDAAPLKPINLEINPINFCNQSCTWCTYGYLHERSEQLDIGKIYELLEDAKQLEVKSLTWTGGGEPTVYKNLHLAMARAVELGFSQGINTNGRNLPKPVQQLICGNFDYIRFSVDAGTDETYCKTHRVKKGEFAKVIENITQLCTAKEAGKSNLTIGFSFLVDHSNVLDLAKAAQLAKEIGVDYFQIKPIVNYVESNDQFSSNSDLWLLIQEQLGLLADLQSDRFSVRFLGHKFNDILKSKESYGRTYDTCRGNELLATVGADGSVDVCCAFKGDKNWSFGNINSQRFREIWEGSERLAVLSKIDVHKCPPLCKAHEINKLIHFMNSDVVHKNFV
jgi:GTP 3',8-cyclase